VRVFSWCAGVATLLATAGYLFVYVYRWEWHRALLVGVLFLGCLIALSTALVLRRLARLHDQLASRSSGADSDERVLRRLREAPVAAQAFPWLTPQDLSRTHIFIPVLLGGGVLVSALAWAVERVAGSSARQGVERELSHELREVAFPRTPLVPPKAEVLACDDAGDDDAQLRLLLGPAAREVSR
jgi:hypothetical protein